MQAWQIRALELEAAALKHLDGFMHEHTLGVFIGVIGLLLALLGWVLSGALRRKGENYHIRPVIFIHLPGPPPRVNPFDPFTPPDNSKYDNHRNN